MVNTLTRRRLILIGVPLVILAGAFWISLARRPAGELGRWQRTMEAKGEKFSLVELSAPLSQAALLWETRLTWRITPAGRSMIRPTRSRMEGPDT